MPPRRSARNAARGRGRGRGRGDVNQLVNNEQLNQGNEEVEGEEEHSVAAAAPAGGDANAPVQAMTFIRWMSMRLDTFDGSGTPTDAADWLRKMEKVMAACRMTTEEMVLFIPHQLMGQADIWWVGVCDAWTPACAAITWEIFLAQFRAKYYPDSFRDKMNDALNYIQ